VKYVESSVHIHDISHQNQNLSNWRRLWRFPEPASYPSVPSSRDENAVSKIFMHSLGCREMIQSGKAPILQANRNLFKPNLYK
jgi:hypothetical protein